MEYSDTKEQRQFHNKHLMIEKFLDVLYYYTYKFYTTIIKDSQPNETTIWAIGMAIGIPLAIFMIFLCGYLWGTPNRELCIGLGIGIEAISVYSAYYYYIKGGRTEKIIKSRPFIKSRVFSGFIIACFYIFWISLLIGGGIIYKKVLDNKSKKDEIITYQERIEKYIPLEE